MIPIRRDPVPWALAFSMAAMIVSTVAITVRCSKAADDEIVEACKKRGGVPACEGRRCVCLKREAVIQ